jgi:hypothetical protein
MEVNSIFFKFDDRRNDKGRGHVIGPGERIFNHFSTDTNKNLRLKFLAIFLINVPQGALIFLTKCVDFLTAGSLVRGLEAGKRAFRLHRLKMYNEDETVHRFAKAYFFTKCICLSVAKDIVKIATYPLCMLGMQCVALAGMASPLDGWVFTCILQETWDQDIHKRISHGGIPLVPKKVMQLLTCSKNAQAIQTSRSLLVSVAPCMQSQQTWKKKNLYRIVFPDYNPNTLRSLKLQFSNLVAESAPYLGSAELQLCTDSIQSWSQQISQISPTANESHEIDKNGNLWDEQDPSIEKLRKKMINSMHSLKQVVRLTDEALEENRDPDFPTIMDTLRQAVSAN